MGRKLTERERNIFIILVVLLFGFNLMQFVIKPLREQNSYFEQDISSKLKSLRKEVKKVRKSKIVEQKYLFFLNVFRQNKSDEKIMSDFLSSIEEVSRKINLSISDLKPKKIKKEQYYNRFSASLIINSQLNEVVNFLSLLQSSPYLLKVDEIKFERISRGKKAFVKTRLSLSKILIPEEI